MRLINRGTIVIVPKKPYYDWSNALTPELLITEETIQEHNAYLVKESIEDVEEVVKKYYKDIFENELLEMWTDEADWPNKRTFKLFNEWFSYYVCAVTYDLGKEGITGIAL